jgi:DNA polymerase-4
MNKHLIFHIDVNSAYLSWSAVKMLEEGFGKDIREIPCIVGGDKESRHGIVLAKSIPAKKYGITTGEPVVNALKKCPQLEIVPPDHDYYSYQSNQFVNILRSYTPDIEQVSVDECYLDYSGISRKFSSPIEAAEEIKEKIKNELGFTVNVGISDVKVLAKMASDFSKPDKIHTLYKYEIQSKMWKLPVEDLFMAGKSSVLTLHKLGIFTIGQLAKCPVNILESHLKSHGRMLYEYANGIDNSVVNTEKEELKGVGNSTTLSHDVDSISEAEKILLCLAEKVGARLRKGNQMAKTIAVEIKYDDFRKVSKQTTLDVATDSGTDIYDISKELFEELWTGQPLRLLGVRTSHLVEPGEPEQLSIMDMIDSKDSSEKSLSIDIIKDRKTREKMKKLDEALDAIKGKYGEDAVYRARFLKDNKSLTDKSRRTEINEGK